MAKPNNTKSNPAGATVTKMNPAKPMPKLEVRTRTPQPSPDNFAVAWIPLGKGAGELTIAYEGPLAEGETLYARYGTQRDGTGPWSETREVELKKEASGRYLGAIPVPEGAPLQAIELVIRSKNDAWDNGGRAPLGYYEWRMGAQRLEVV